MKSGHALMGVLSITVLLSGCESGYENMKRICIADKEKEIAAFSEFSNYDIKDSDKAVREKKALYLDAQAMMKSAREMPGDKEYVCPSLFSHKANRDEVAGVVVKPYRRTLTWQEELALSNKRLDDAQDEMMADYKKQAVRHIQLPAGRGIKVESFEMKDGSVVTCKTSVTNVGRAIDCR